jgi:hypothetical protein
VAAASTAIETAEVTPVAAPPHPDWSCSGHYGGP